VKAVLRQKNRLMRAGRTEEAGSLARRIDVAIIRKNTAQLREVDWMSAPKDMWATVRELINLRAREALAPQGISAQVLKDHFAANSTDPTYQQPKPKSTCSTQHPGLH
jgi:hypothetical protein